ncbi:hypothetical protein EON82_05115 [bacterium]|nr:MAG: hypothetical protein EON82_05115 [bacterium]
MSLSRSSDVDGFRAELRKGFRPLDHKTFEALRNRVVEALDGDGRIVVQKARRTEKPEALLEVVCAWTGVDPDPRAAVSALKEAWPFAESPREEERFYVEPVAETVVLLSALKQEERYATVRVLVVP